VTGELVRCARALVSGETRNDFAFVVHDGSIVASGDFLEVRDRGRDLHARSFRPIGSSFPALSTDTVMPINPVARMGR